MKIRLHPLAMKEYRVLKHLIPTLEQVIPFALEFKGLDGLIAVTKQARVRVAELRYQGVRTAEELAREKSARRKRPRCKRPRS